MFYLKEAFKLRASSYLVVALWAMSAVVMIGSLGHSKKIEQFFSAKGDKVNSLPFFYALIDSDRPFERAMRKLRELPGVSVVSSVASTELEKSLKSTIEQAGLDMKTLLGGPSVTGLKVVFDSGLAEGGQKLVRDYLVRLVGDDYITLGAVSVPDAENFKSQGVVTKITTYSPWILFSVATLVWFWAFTFLLGHWRERAYLIERFQRRKNVLIKMISSSSLALFLAAFLLNAWFAPVQLMALMSLAVLGASLSLSLWRGGQWEAS